MLDNDAIMRRGSGSRQEFDWLHADPFAVTTATRMNNVVTASSVTGVPTRILCNGCFPYNLTSPLPWVTSSPRCVNG